MELLLMQEARLSRATSSSLEIGDHLRSWAVMGLGLS